MAHIREYPPKDSDKHLFTLLFYFIIEGHVICDGTFQKTLRAIGFKSIKWKINQDSRCR